MEQASTAYLRSAVLTATPEQLHLMLYDGAIRFTRQAVEGIRAKDWERAFNGFSRAQKIVLEMHHSLNYDVDRDLCQKMAGLYNFVYRRLVEASTSRDAALAADALKILEYQRETWVLLIDKLRQEQPAPRPVPKPVPEPAAEPVGQHAIEEPAYGTLSVEG